MLEYDPLQTDIDFSMDTDQPVQWFCLMKI